MDLEAFARTNGLASCIDEVRAWRRELSDDDDGRAIRRNLRRDTQLEDCSTGHTAVTSLVRRIATRATVTPSAGSPWLTKVLTDHSDELLCQGRAVPSDPSTDLVARATPLRNVATYLVHRNTLTRTLGFYPASTAPTRRLRLWARRFLSTPARARIVIDSTALVRGMLPLVFACPDVDRQRQWPSGTAISDINAVLGLPPTIPPVDLCVLRFHHSATMSQGHVPTGLDAYTHSYFQPAPAGSHWGWTRDLRGPSSPPTLGVRECVVSTFPAGLIQDFETVEA